MRPDTVDFLSTNYGSIVTLAAITQDALDWVDQNIDAECTPHIATVDIDARYFLDIACGILRDGLTLKDTSTGRLAELPA